MSDLFDPYPVETHDLMLLFTAAGWTWDYWGKFYGPDSQGSPKVREIKHVLNFIRSAWSCPSCKCEGCTCCSPGMCHNEGYTTYPCVQPFVDAEAAWRESLK